MRLQPCDNNIAVVGAVSLEKNQKLAKIIQTINSLAVVVLLILSIILFDQLAMREEIKW